VPARSKPPEQMADAAVAAGANAVQAAKHFSRPANPAALAMMVPLAQAIRQTKAQAAAALEAQAQEAGSVVPDKAVRVL